jgi:hypothetical protein
VPDDEQTPHQHRWTRYEDPETGVWNHWCVDGDTEHHDEPCADAASQAGDHEHDAGDQETWPVLRPL